MSWVLHRIDDRLIHGQVVVGWGQALGIEFIVLVDDDVRASDWEQELYRMGVPPDLAVEFVTVAEAATRRAAWEADPRAGIVLLGDVATATAIVCSDLPSATEWIEERVSGRVVPPRDLEALVRATLDLLDDPAARAGYGARALEKVRAHADHNRNMARVEEIYRRLVDQARSGR